MCVEARLFFGTAFFLQPFFSLGQLLGFPAEVLLGVAAAVDTD